jgi:pimeloyl-ACP methyl ester carboxylesterase
MPQVEVDQLTINYEVQGEGEPLLLIPYTSADHACYAFQLPAYTEHFSCIAIDLPGSGESDKPPGPYSTDGYADQVAAFLDAIGVERAHVAGMSLGAAVGIHLAARHPGRVRSLSLHSGWDTTPLITISGSSSSSGERSRRRCRPSPAWWSTASSRGASRLRCTSNGRSSSTR